MYSNKIGIHNSSNFAQPFCYLKISSFSDSLIFWIISEIKEILFQLTQRLFIVLFVQFYRASSIMIISDISFPSRVCIV